MYYSAQLVLTNYKPLHIEQGMWFKNVVYPNTDREYTEIWILTKHIRTDEELIRSYGYPIEIHVIANGEVLAYPHQIGWWDEGDCTDELRDITIRDINSILRNEGKIEIDISENAYKIGVISPTIEEGKVILRYPIEDEEEIDDMPVHNDSEEEEPLTI
jgi:hypothetical protein